MLHPQIGPQTIPAESPGRAVWDWLQLFEIPEQAERLIRRRISLDFAGLKRSTIQQQWTRKNAGTVPALHSTADAPAIAESASAVAATLKQAREVWELLENTTVLAEPLLMMYAAEHLAVALYQSTYKGRAAESHGMHWDRASDAVDVRRMGLFQQQHDAHTHAPAVYLARPTFQLNQLFAVNIDLMDEFAMVLGEPAVNNPGLVDRDREISSPASKPIRTKSGAFTLHPIDYRLLTLFILGSKVRYQPDVWAVFLESAAGFVARRFVERTRRVLPNLFLNEMLSLELTFEDTRSFESWTHFELDDPLGHL